MCCDVDLSRLAGDPSVQPFRLLFTNALMPAILLRLLCAVLRGRQSTSLSGSFEDSDVFNLAAGGFVLAGLIWSVNWASCHFLFGADYVYWQPITFMAETLCAAVLLWAARLYLPRREKPSLSAVILRWGYTGVAGFMMLCLLLINPFIMDQRIAEFPLLLLAAEYGLPILTVIYAITHAIRYLPDGVQGMCKKTGLGFVEIAGFVLLSTMTYVIFNGPSDPLSFITPEIWALSAVWMVYGGALIFLGFACGETALRYGGITVIGITALKVLLVDTTSLDGMARVGSLFCLGIVLIAIGMLYQNYARISEAR